MGELIGALAPDPIVLAVAVAADLTFGDPVYAWHPIRLVGRTLDFLLQETNREVNTVGSKADDLEISQAVITAKSLLEKLRELMGSPDTPQGEQLCAKNGVLWFCTTAGSPSSCCSASSDSTPPLKSASRIASCSACIVRSSSPEDGSPHGLLNPLESSRSDSFETRSSRSI